MQKIIAAAVAAAVLLVGAATASAAVVPANDNWGIVNRNVIGAADAQLRSGPAPAPFGIGSLNLSVATGADKIAYGNEVDYRGDRLQPDHVLHAGAGADRPAERLDPHGADHEGSGQRMARRRRRARDRGHHARLRADDR